MIREHLCKEQIRKVGRLVPASPLRCACTSMVSRPMVGGSGPAVAHGYRGRSDTALGRGPRTDHGEVRLLLLLRLRGCCMI